MNHFTDMTIKEILLVLAILAPLVVELVDGLFFVLEI
jgi:hypothetical protein